MIPRDVCIHVYGAYDEKHSLTCVVLPYLIRIIITWCLFRLILHGCMVYKCILYFQEKTVPASINHYLWITVVLEALAVVTFAVGVAQLSLVPQLGWSFYLAVFTTVFTLLFLLILLFAIVYCKYLSVCPSFCICFFF